MRDETTLERGPARAVIEGDEIVIRLPIATIGVAVQAGNDLLVFDVPIRVTDAALFAPEMVAALNDEDEEGTTPIMKLFDAAVWSAFEGGAEGIEEDADVDS